MRWPWQKRAAPAALSSPYGPLVEWAGANAFGGALGAVTEKSMLGLSAFYRAISLISGQLAMLPMESFSSDAQGVRRRVPSIFDNPDGDDGQTPFEWKESAFVHLLLHGRTGALKVRNEAGGLARLPLVHPLSFTVHEPTARDYDRQTLPAGGLWFHVRLQDGRTKRLDGNDFWYIPGMSLNGVETEGLIRTARQSIGTTAAADRAAYKMFSKGALISGIAVPADDEDITDDVPKIKREILAATGGAENAGTIAVINRRLDLKPWTMTAVDAQFLQSRQFQIEEVSRWTGVPPHLLMQTEKQTSWGTGVEEQNRAMGRSVLGVWATRFEQRGSRLLAKPRHVEFAFDRLERPSPDREIEVDLSQVAAGVMTKDEYRMKRGWEPLPKEAAADPAPAPEPGQEDDPDA
jgi:HK97 family phage portal protein